MIDRHRLLQQRANALAALRHPDLPQSIREKWKKVADHAELALGMMDAIQMRSAHD